MKEKYPIRAKNVVMEDKISGLKLRGVLIRPEIGSESSANESKSYFIDDSYFVVTSRKTRKGERMATFVRQETFSRIVAGEDVAIKCRLYKVDLKWEMDNALEDVRLSNERNKK